MAVLAEFLVGGLDAARLRLLAGRVLAVDGMVGGADFIETFRLLRHDQGFAARAAFVMAMRIARRLPCDSRATPVRAPGPCAVAPTQKPATLTMADMDSRVLSR